MNNGEVRSVYIIYYHDAGRVTSPLFADDDQRRDLVRLYLLQYTDRVTSPLSGNEQRRDEVRQYYLLYTDRITAR